jgi:hypothetical protein
VAVVMQEHEGRIPPKEKKTFERVDHERFHLFHYAVSFETQTALLDGFKTIEKNLTENYHHDKELVTGPTLSAVKWSVYHKALHDIFFFAFLNLKKKVDHFSEHIRPPPSSLLFKIIFHGAQHHVAKHECTTRSSCHSGWNCGS